MEIKEILDRQEKIKEAADNFVGAAAATAATCFWLAEIALQLARSNQGNRAK